MIGSRRHACLRLACALFALAALPACATALLVEVAPESRPQAAHPTLDAQLASHAGRPVLINFWASWCAPCREEMPALQALADRGTVVLTVAVADRQSDTLRFMESAGVSLPLVHDRDQRAGKAWGARMLPCTVVLDSAHRIVARAQGVIEWDTPAVREQLRRLMR